VNLARNERGAVYVEFLLAFLPIFLMFLAICQVSFLVVGRLVVSHAALAGARSAIVVLEDDPDAYGGAERGWLSDKPPAKTETSTFAALGQLTSGAPSSDPTTTAAKPQQQGLRMQAIRRAALRPLAAIAPTAGAFLAGRNGTLQASLEGDSGSARAFARVYVDAAAVVTVHDPANVDQLVAEPVGRTAPITVRVTFVQLCGIPVVRGLMCHSLPSLLESPITARKGISTGKEQTLRQRLVASAMPGWLELAAPQDARFVVFKAEVTLPNQGAAYDYAEKSDDENAAL
jgi:hypothetical protein